MRAQSHLSLRHVPDDLPDCNCGGGLCCPDDPLELVLQFFPTPVAGEGSLASIGIAGSPLPLGPAQDNGFGDVRVLGSPGCCGGAVWEGDSCGVSNRVPEGTEPIDVTEYLDLPDDGGGSEAATVCNPSWDMAIVAAPTPAGRALGGLVSNGAPPSLLPVSLGARQPYTFPAFDGVASNDAPPLPAPMAADGGLHACHTLVAAAPDDTLMAAGGGLQACRTLVVANPNDTLPIPAGALHACGPLVGVGVVSNNAPHIPTGALQALPLQAHAPASAWTTPASRTSSGSLTPTASETNSLAPVWQPLAWVYPRTRRRSPGKCRKRPWSLEFPLRVIPAAPPPDDPGDNSGNYDMKNNCFSAGGGGIRRRRPVPRQRNRQAQRVCSHCHSSDTPQWRAGPNGPGTLCNACGIRYAANKLLPEYRPSTAPSFQSGQHSNRHRKVVKIREEKVQQTVKAMSDDPVPVSPKSDEFMDGLPGAHRSATHFAFATTMQEPSRAMRHETDGEVAAGVDNSHANEQERTHGITIRGCRADADTGEEDEEQPSSMDDARVEFPSDDDDIDGDSDDVRISFASAVGDRLVEEDEEQAEVDMEAEEEEDDTSRYDYGMWMQADEPVSIQERRRRLLQGMGLNSSRDLLRSRNARGPTATARLPPDIPRSAPPRRHHHHTPSAAADEDDAPSSTATTTVAAAAAPPPPAIATRLTRSRSDSRLAVRGGGARKPPPSFRRVHSLPHSLRLAAAAAAAKDIGTGKSTAANEVNGGKEFVVKGQRSAPLSVKELERFIGYTPLVKQLMLRSQSQPVPAAAKGGDTTKTPEKKRMRWLKNIKLVSGLRTDKDSKDGDATMSKSASVSSSSAATERQKVHHYGKSSKELTGVYMRQEVRAHEGSIWTIKFSPDGRFLASAGEDRIVRVWEVSIDADASSSTAAQNSGRSAAAAGLAAQLSRRMRRGRSGKGDVLPDHVVVPESVFALAEQPACAFEGHQDDVLDLSWSRSVEKKKLLSSSMDKTVRLWDVDTRTCLKMFPHNDYVTCVQFNPVDDGYFISGSLDCKVRIWSVPDRQVVDWSDVSDMVTAACYTPDGQAAIIGTHKGSCRFYKTTDCKLNQEAQIDMSISKKRRSQAKKITGFQFAPGNPSEILVTSADSQIRVFNGITVLQKFKGFKNTSSQISASYTADGRHVVCASEDSNVYVWRRVPTSASADGDGIGVRAKTWLTSRSYEYFFCRDVSVAVPWPGSPPSPELKKKQGGREDPGVPPRRHKSGPMGYPGAQRMQQQPELYRRESSTSSSARWHGGAEGGNAWGMVVVTASRGGEIRVYQNFGMPLGNLFH